MWRRFRGRGRGRELGAGGACQREPVIDERGFRRAGGASGDGGRRICRRRRQPSPFPCRIGAGTVRGEHGVAHPPAAPVGDRGRALRRSSRPGLRSRLRSRLRRISRTRFGLGRRSLPRGGGPAGRHPGPAFPRTAPGARLAPADRRRRRGGGPRGGLLWRLVLLPDSRRTAARHGAGSASGPGARSCSRTACRGAAGAARGDRRGRIGCAR